MSYAIEPPAVRPPAPPAPAGPAGGDRGRPTRVTPEPSTAELVQHATEQLSRLVRDELALARAELLGTARHAGLGIGLLGAGGLLALYGLGALVLAAVFGLAVVLPGWLAALIVGGGLFALALLTGVAGVGQARQAVPPVPQRLAGSVRADIDTVTSAVRDRRRP
jgi:hypothetical protein